MEKIHQGKKLLPNLPCIAKKLQELWQIFVILWNFQKENGGGGVNANHVFSKNKITTFAKWTNWQKLYAIISLQ